MSYPPADLKPLRPSSLDALQAQCSICADSSLASEISSIRCVVTPHREDPDITRITAFDVTGAFWALAVYFTWFTERRARSSVG